MKLHERRIINDHIVTKVPGGWLYHDQNDKTETFVPEVHELCVTENDSAFHSMKKYITSLEKEVRDLTEKISELKKPSEKTFPNSWD